MTDNETQDWDDKPNNNKQKHSPKGSGWRDLPATQAHLASLFQTDAISLDAWTPAQDMVSETPSAKDWLKFGNLLLTGLGTILLLAGILFFFAFNWDDLSKWQRFAVVEGAVILSTVLAFFFNLDKWTGRLALGASAILLGVALAVISQEYQTGADSYRLFQVWLMLITGWVLISRWNIMYLIWMVLLNVTIGFYWEQIIRGDWQTFNIIVLSLNAGFVFLWDGIAKLSKFKFMQDGRWFLYIFMAVALSHGTSMMGDYIFDSRVFGESTTFAPIVYLGLLVLTFGFYTLVKRDLLMLTFSALSVLVVSVIWIGRILAEGMWENDGWVIFFFIMGGITVGLTAVLIKGLQAIRNKWEEKND